MNELMSLSRAPKMLASSAAPSPVLTPEAMTALAHQILDMTTAGVVGIRIDHMATGITRVSKNHVRLTNNGDALTLQLSTQFGRRGEVGLSINQLDPETLRETVQYAERIAHEQPGDPAPGLNVMPISPRTYLPNTTWHESTAAALLGDRHSTVPLMVQPLVDAKLRGTAFVGVAAQATMIATKQGMLALGHSTDVELVVSGWDPAGTGGAAASGWAGQVSRDWATLDPAAVAVNAVRLAKLGANPVAFEPGRRTAILDRPAMAQIIRAIGRDYDYDATMMGVTPLSDHKLHDKIWDERLTLSSDPNDPDGGYLPFDNYGYPRVAMTWLKRGRLTNLAYSTYTAANNGVTPANLWPESLRVVGIQDTPGAPPTVEDMIANCKEGIYVNRVADIEVLHSRSGVMTGVTTGGCFLVRNGKIDKAVKDFRFLDSAYFFLNKLEMVGTSARAPFGYAPWHGDWPIAPTIVPPVMVRDFNFVALADAV